MSGEDRVIRSYLDDAQENIEAYQLLAASRNRHAAYMLQQAAEKLVKALRISLRLYATKEHRIRELLRDIPDENPWRERLLELEVLSQYATTFRYPTPGGRLKQVDFTALAASAEVVRRLLAELRSALLGG